MDAFLSTKLFIPALRPNRVNRPRLHDRLNSGLDKALILVSAPAGYGKSTLVSGWLHEIAVPSTWLSLDEADNDPVRFLQYFILALQKIDAAFSLDLISLLQGKQSPAFIPLLNVIINKIAGRSSPFILVLDDFHNLQSQPVLDMLAYLLEYAPPHLHIAILSRADPPFSLASLRARGQLVDIRAEHLRFTLEEVSSFLSDGVGLDLTSSEIAAMQARTEGWIAGLQLAAVSMQADEDVHNFVTAFTGSHYYIMDYLTEEVLKRQPEALRSFLLQTSILERMCAPLCATVVDPGVLEQAGAQAMLEDLERKNLFLVPLDDVRHWYRYHHLFAEVLKRRLEHQHSHLLPALYRRASGWCEQNGLIPAAIQNSLAAGDHAHAIQLIEQNGVLLLIRGEVTTLLKWIEAVEPHARARPWLSIFKAWAFALSGNLDQVNGMLRAAEQLIAALEPAPEFMTMQGTIAAARAYQSILQGELRQAADFARQALACLPATDLITGSLRTVATSLLGDASLMSGDLEQARQAYLEAAPIAQAAGDVNLIIVLNSNFANILVEQGALHQAAKIYADTIHLSARPDGQMALIAGRVYAELGIVYYEWNQQKEAAQYIQQSLALCQQWGNMDQQAVCYILLARLEHIQSRPDKLQEALLAAEQLVKNYDLAPRHAAWVKGNLVRMWIVQGDLERAAGFLKLCGMPLDAPGLESALDGDIPYLAEPVYLAWMRLLYAQGRYAESLALGRRLFHSAQASQRVWRMIEVLVLQALAFYAQKDTPQAVEVLARALSLAQPEGFVRVFLDEGEPMVRLLYLVKAQRSGHSYASELLSAFLDGKGTARLPAQPLIEPLTSRELEILALIESGCSNQEIAAKLVISMPTVKRHISNLYAKLGARSRTQAVSLARELNLFHK